MVDVTAEFTDEVGLDEHLDRPNPSVSWKVRHFFFRVRNTMAKKTSIKDLFKSESSFFSRPVPKELLGNGLVDTINGFMKIMGSRLQFPVILSDKNLGEN